MDRATASAEDLGHLLAGVAFLFQGGSENKVDKPIEDANWPGHIAASLTTAEVEFVAKIVATYNCPPEDKGALERLRKKLACKTETHWKADERK